MTEPATDSRAWHTHQARTYGLYALAELACGITLVAMWASRGLHLTPSQSLIAYGPASLFLSAAFVFAGAAIGHLRESAKQR